MKVLFLTNFFPPHSFGGYEEWCQEVALGLRQRGHDVLVLASRYSRQSDEVGAAGGEDADWVMRDLHLEMSLEPLRNSWAFFTERRRNERANLAQLQEVVATFQPDVALIWGMWNLPRSVPQLAEELLGTRVAYYVADYWPSLKSQHWDYWQVPAGSPLSMLPKSLLRPIALRQLQLEAQPHLDLCHVIVPTEYVRLELRRLGIAPHEIVIVPGAIDTAAYMAASETKATRHAHELTLLYVGRLSEEKGVHTAIEALATSHKDLSPMAVRLLVVGSGSSDYEARLHDLEDALDVGDKISWLGRLPKQALPSIYQSADIFLFTSIWPEPFGRVIVEAMAAGTAVIGAPVGGAAEILENDCNSLTFTPGDAYDLAHQISRLGHDAALRTRLAQCGQVQATTQWDLKAMVSAIEGHLLRL